MIGSPIKIIAKRGKKMTTKRNKSVYSDVVVIGGASIDKTHFQREDGTYATQPDIELYGGKGANQAIAAARAGASTTFISLVGSDVYGEGIVKNLEVNGVDASRICSVPMASDASTIRVNYVTKDNEITRSNAAINSFTDALIEENKDALLHAKYVVGQLKAPKEFTVALIQFCWRNHKPLALTACKPEKLAISDPANKELIDKIDILFCNEHEAEVVFGTTDFVECVTAYPCKLVITRGEKGLLFHDGESVIELPAISTNVEDTTGAGDTLCGNVIAALCDGCTMLEALKRGVCAATLKIQKKGAQTGMPYDKELKAFIEALKVASTVGDVVRKNGDEVLKHYI